MKNKLAKNSMAVGVATLIVTAGLSFSAQAAPLYETYAKATLLSGSLDALANTGTAVADNDGKTVQKKAENPATLTVLSAITIPALNIDLGQILGAGSIQTGAIEQYAEANNNGKARAAAGAVSDSGGADLGAGAGGFPKSAVIDLSKLLGGAVTDLANGTITIGAVTAVADQSTPTNKTLAGTCGDLANPVQCRDYNIGDVKLDVTSKVLGTISSQVIGGLLGTTLGNLDKVDIGVAQIKLPTLADILKDLSNLSADGVTVNLDAGTISVDVDAVLKKYNNGLGLNDIAPSEVGTNILTKVLPNIGPIVVSLVNEAIFGDPADQVAEPGLVTRILNDTKLIVLGTEVPLTDLVKGLLMPVLNLLTATLTDLTDALVQPLTDLTNALDGIIALNVNRQYTDGDLLAENALQVKLLGNIDVNLATAAIRPASAVVVVDDGNNNNVVDDNADDPSDADTPSNDDNSDNAADSVSDNDSDADANADADAVADADSQADADVTQTLPDTGAPNLLPFMLLGMGLILFGAAVLVNEKRRLGKI